MPLMARQILVHILLMDWGSLLQETSNRLLRLQLADTTNSFRAAMATAQTFLEQGA